MRRRQQLLILLALVCVLALPAQVAAQPGAAISLSIDPSVRSIGMGHASSSVFWGDEPNYWANPALLGHHSGLHYQWSKEQLVPSLAENVFFESSRFTFGQWGLGVAFSGKPFHLDYGSGPPGHEQIDSYGFGVNVIELGETVMGLIMPVDAGVGRYFDFSVGWMKKNVDVYFGQAPGPTSEIRGSAEPRDFGIQSRLTPLDTIDRPMPQYIRDHMAPLAQFLDAVGGMRIDFTIARSWLNYNDVELRYDNDTQDAILQDSRRGIGFHIASGVPHDKFTVLQGGSWLAALFTPVLRFGMTWDRSAVAAQSGEVLTHYSGWEATILNVFSVRGGRTDSPQTGIVDEHSGWGLGLRIGDICGVRWDEARRPQALPENTTARGFSAFVDFVALSEWGLDR